MCCYVLTQLAGVHSTTVTTLPDGTFDLEQLELKIRHGYPDPHYPRSRLICVENTHNIQGGRVLPLTFLQEVCAVRNTTDCVNKDQAWEGGGGGGCQGVCQDVKAAVTLLLLRMVCFHLQGACFGRQIWSVGSHGWSQGDERCCGPGGASIHNTAAHAHS